MYKYKGLLRPLMLLVCMGLAAGTLMGNFVMAAASAANYPGGVIKVIHHTYNNTSNTNI